MGRISNLSDFNTNRQDLIKVKTSADQTILLSNDEAKEILKTFIAEDLDFFSSGISKKVKFELDNKIASKLTRFELAMVNHIDNKFNSVTEKIIATILDSKIEEEVERRLEEKLAKIRKSL